MRRIAFTSESADRCELIFGKDLINKLPQSVRIVDSGFKKFFGKSLEGEYLMPGGEHIKSVDRVFEIYQLIRTCKSKAITVIGGGSIIDLVGYASAGHAEVEKLFLFPTTTVSQIMPALNGFGVNFEFVKDLLSSRGVPNKVFIDSSISFWSYSHSSRSDFLFPLLVALSFDKRLFKYLFNHLLSGSELPSELWDDVIFSSAKAYLTGIEIGKSIVGGEIGKHIETASRLRAGNQVSLIVGAMIELRLAVELGASDNKIVEDFFQSVKLLWKKDWTSRIDMSSLVDVIYQKGGVRISMPDGGLDKTLYVGAKVFERFVREKTWRGLESFV
ncbi:MAG: 3-dehydroquinate synthase [Mesotoga sp.]|uniref:3-dehydroquinate synthase n=1 Tax=Mesotoga sp. TaxID=2053577 RepID=UPI002622BEE8|nr:3-dehydroquinate synthase [Mesotoga sp.]MDD3681166.1 3-dehydroquinate synthase [Mesotoga sp.]MDD4206417.1 3-dehydroquinate synthase [Mesotoga sp.]MDD5681782.1 3-dehydroquinate synthase [Mesotoga sp.]MDI9369068.1 3-dehydroquinate synthase [Thermotogota bacterium]